MENNDRDHRAAQRRTWIAAAGGINKVSADIGVSAKRLDQWCRRGVPHEFVVKLAERIDVPPALLSPNTAKTIVAPWIAGRHNTSAD